MIKIHRNTYYKWLKNQPAFRIAIKHADADLDDTVEQVLIDKAKHGSSSELLFYLKKRHEKYKDTPTAIGVKGENIEVVIIDYKSREEWYYIGCTACAIPQELLYRLSPDKDI